MNNEIILTPMQVQDLKVELVQLEEALIAARGDMQAYKEVEDDKTGCNDYTVLDNSYYERLSSLVTEIDEKKQLLANHILATPTGNTVQVGSVVELADRNLKFMVVQSMVNKKPSMKEVSVNSPIFGAIYMHKTGDICEYSVDGRELKCVIGNVDNEYSAQMAKDMEANDNTLDHGAKTR